MRQKQGGIEFVRAGDCVRTDDWLKGEPMINMGYLPVFIARKKRKEVEILPYGGGTYTFLIWRRRRTGQIPFLI